MAKKTATKINKSQAIRDLFDKLGLETKNKLISDTLKEQGIEVQPAAVSNIKKQLKEEEARKAAKVAETASADFGALIEVKELAARLGGIANLKKAIEALERLGVK